jgi:hypothetical protein
MRQGCSPELKICVLSSSRRASFIVTVVHPTAVIPYRESGVEHFRGVADVVN